MTEVPRHGLRFGLLTALLAAGLAPAARAAGTVPVRFAAEGPDGVFATQGMSEGTEPWSGAVTAVVPDPAHANVALLATADGGIWRTTDLGAATPTWTPRSDHAPSLSIASLSFDPTAGAGDRVAIAGIGHRSSFRRVGGPLTGLLKSTNGGVTWTALPAAHLAGVDVSGAAIRGRRIVVTARGTDSGVWLSQDGGATFHPRSGKPGQPPPGPAYDLVGDPRHPGRLYAAIGGAHGGVYRSDHSGRKWRVVGDGSFGTARSLTADAVNMRLAVGPRSTVWVAVAGPVADAAHAAQDDDESSEPGTSGDDLDGLFRTTGDGRAWQAVDVAKPTDPLLAVNPGGQAGVHLAIAGDPADASVVYVGGDHVPEGGAGAIVACDADPAHPAAADSRWTSLGGKLDAIEAHSCAWDNLLQTAMCGLQDAGTADQRATGRLGWNELGRFDGNDLAIADGLGANGSTAYFSAHGFVEFERRVCTSPAACVTTAPALNVAGTGTTLPKLPNVPSYDPIAADGSCPSRLAVDAGALFESTDAAQTFRPVPGLPGDAEIEALAYTGAGCADPAGRLYVAATSGLFVRPAGAASLSRVTAYRTAAQGAPLALSVDPGDGRSVWVASARRVTHVRVGANAATDVTGDLAPPGKLRSIAFIPGVVGGIVLAGADGGMYMTAAADLGAWSRVSGRLPHVVVATLEFDPVGDVLLAGTLGRGAWKLANAKDTDVPPGILGLTGGHGMIGAKVSLKGGWEDPDRVRLDRVTGRISFGDHTGTHVLTLRPDGRFTATHTYSAAGRMAVKVTLTDVPGAKTTRTVTETIGA